MRILQVVPYFYPAWAYGGPGKLVFDISTYFAQQGHQVTIYTGDGYDQKQRMKPALRLRGQNPQVFYFKNLNNFFAYTYNFFFTPALYWVALLNIKSFDVVHIHDFLTLQNFYIGFLCRVFHIPYVLSPHGCLEKKRLEQRSIVKKIFLNFYGYQLVKKADRIIASSKNELQDLLDLGIAQEKLTLLGHGIVLEEFVTKLSQKQAREKLKLPAKKIIITFLGRIHRIKGLDQLVKTIALLKDQPQLFFVIAGSDDGYLKQLKADIKTLQIGAQLKLLGTSFGETKNRLFKASDIFVYPSYSEGFSLGVLEAAAAALPLVISTGCHFELVKHRQAGFVVKNTPELLKKAILQLSQDKALRLQYGQNAKKLIKEKYAMSLIGESLLDLYETIR